MKKLVIYVPHYSKLVERRYPLAKALFEAGFYSYTLFERFNQDGIIESEFSANESLIRSKIKDFIPEPVIKTFLRDGMTQGEKSLALKHKYILKEFAENSGPDDYLLLLEDDARLPIGTSKIIKTLLQSAKFQCVNLCPSSFDAVAPFELENLSNIKLTHHKRHAFSSGTCGYLMTPVCAARVFEELDKIPICVPIDWELSHIFMSGNLQCHKINPPLVYQASMAGEFLSSVRERGENYFSTP